MAGPDHYRHDGVSSGIHPRSDRGSLPPDRDASWPTGHVGWTFSGISRFEARVTRFLAEGLWQEERLMFVADDPNAAHWPLPLLERGALQVVSTAETYGPDRIVDAQRQLATFESVLAEALQEGYRGVRVAADNTSLVSTPERLEAWQLWEKVAEVLMADKPLTGLCGFDRSRLEPAVIHSVQGLHPTLVSDGG